MARVAFSAEVADIRGKIGSVVFSRARSGATIRSRGPVRNPKSAAQTAVRGHLGRASSTFKGLSSTNVTAWRAYAATQTATDEISGEVYAPSANAVFVGLATKFLQATPTGTIPTTPPSAPFTGDAVTVSAAGSSGQVAFTATGANAVSVAVELLLQPLASANRTPRPNGYRTKQYHVFVAGALTVSFALPVGWYAPAYRFVNLVTGQSTGLVTLPLVEVS